MGSYIIRRVLQMGVTLFIVSILSFLIVALAPGDPLSAQLDPNAKPADIERQRDQMGFDDPVVQKYIKFYTNFFTDLAHTVIPDDPDDKYVWKLRSAKTQEPVLPTMWNKMLITLPLVILTTLIVWSISFPVGILGAQKRNSIWDWLITFLSFGMIAIPGFWLMIMVVMFISTKMNLPVVGPSTLGVEQSGVQLIMDMTWHTAIPALIGALVGVAVLNRYVKGEMLEVKDQDYIRTARAKGLDEDTVTYKHALRNASLTFITMLSGLLPSLFGGSVVAESIFGWPGLGRWFFEAALQKDLFVVITSLFVGSGLTLVGILISDLLYGVADPRVKLA